MPDAAALRLAALYAALFSVIGLVLPFWPVWLHGRGLSAAQISAVLTTGMVVRILASPLLAFAADRRGERARPIAALALVSAAAYAGFALCRDFWAILLVTLIASAAFASLQPLTDTLALRVSAAHRLDYGRVRLWGSLAFIAASYGGGALLGRFGPDAILWGIVAACAAGAVCARAVPDPPGQPSGAPPVALPAAVRLLGRSPFLLLVGSASLIQASHAVYYAFGTLHWQHVGYPDWLIGALWGLGVMAEIGLFAASGRAMRRFGPVGLIMLGGLGGAIRWAATAFDPNLPVLAGLQLLHALTFGATFLGAIHFIGRAVPPDLSATAQSVLGAASGGLALGAATLLAGWLYPALGGQAYLAMAILAGLGGLGAWCLGRRWDGHALTAR